MGKTDCGGNWALFWWVGPCSVQFSSSVMSDSLRPHELQHARPPCPSPVTSTTGCCFCFGSISLLGTYRPGEFIFQCHIFLPLILFMEFSKQECWSGLPSPSPVDHIFSELSTMTHLSWVALHGMGHTFIELDKAVVHVISLISFLLLWFSLCLPFEG